MKRNVLIRALCLSVLLIAVGAVTAGAAPVKGFSDPPGDAKGGPDIRSVLVSDTAGIVSMTLNVTGVKVSPETGVSDTGVLTWLDTNKNGHADYAVVFGQDTDGPYYYFLNMATGKPIPASPKMGFTASGNTYKFRFGSTDIGGATAFDFSSASATWDEGGSRTDLDAAPDIGAWSYAMTSVKPVLGTPTIFPASPVAGRPLAVTMPVTRSDSGDRITTGATMVLDPLVGGQVASHTEQLKGGTVVLRMTVPVTAKGKLLTIRTSITYAGQTVTKVIPLRVA